MNKMFNVYVQLSWFSLLHLFVDRSGIRVAQYLKVLMQPLSLLLLVCVILKQCNSFKH